MTLIRGKEPKSSVREKEEVGEMVEGGKREREGGGEGVDDLQRSSGNNKSASAVIKNRKQQRK